MSQAGAINSSSGSLAIPVTVPNGGTGQTTLAIHTVLIGQGTSAIGTAGPGDANSILMGQGAGADPVFGTLIAGSNITLTPGATSITISSSGGGGAGSVVFTGDAASTATTNAGAINIFGDLATGSSVLGDGAQTITVANLPATTSQKGVVQIATNAQAIAGSDTAAAITSDDLKAKLGTQSTNGIPYGQGTSTAIAWTAQGGANTVLLGNGGVPSFGAVPNAALANSTVTLSSGNNITVTGGGPLALGGVASFNVTGTTNHAVLLGNATASISSAALGTNGQVLIGSTGADPTFGTITSGDGSITVTGGAGTLALSVTSGTTVGKTITGDTGGALSPTAGNWNILGTAAQGLSFAGVGSTLTGTIANASESQKGVAELASNAETIAGTDTERIVTPDDLKAKLGVQTTNGVAFGAGTAAALSWTGSANYGVLISSGAGVPSFLANGTTGQVLTATTGSTPSWSTGTAGTITGDTGGALSQTASNWNIIGQQAGTVAVMDTVGSVSTLSIEDRTWTTQLVVDPSSTVGLRGTFTTIAAAITAAVSGQTILVRPGTYTENLTGKDGVGLWAASGTSVTINGKLTNSSGTFSVTGITFNNTSATTFEVTGGAVNALDCIIKGTGYPAITASGGGSFSTKNCVITGVNAGGTHFSCGASSIIAFDYSTLNTDNTSTTNTCAGTVQVHWCIMYLPISFSGSGYAGLNFVQFQNMPSTSLVFTGTSTADIFDCSFNAGANDVMTVASGCYVRMLNCDIISTATNIITGAGEIIYNGLDYYYYPYQNNITVSTQNGAPFFSAYNTGTTNLTGDGTVATLVFATELKDQCNNFSTSTFTCVDPGKYYFEACVTLTGLTSSHDLAELKLVTSSNTFMLEKVNTANAKCSDNVATLKGSCLVYMAYAETATVTIKVDGGSKVVDTSGTAVNTYFQGYKIEK